MQAIETLATLIIADPAIVARLVVDELVKATPADTQRWSKACDIVNAQHVERLPEPHRFLVVSQSQGNAAYTVDDRHGCHCPDAAGRAGARGCKHYMALYLATAAERVEAEQGDPLDPDSPIPYILTPEALEWLDGEHVELPRQCSRCHAEDALPRHCDGLGARCVSRELYGDSDDAA